MRVESGLLPFMGCSRISGAVPGPRGSSHQRPPRNVNTRLVMSIWDAGRDSNHEGGKWPTAGAVSCDKQAENHRSFTASLSETTAGPVSSAQSELLRCKTMSRFKGDAGPIPRTPTPTSESQVRALHIFFACSTCHLCPLRASCGLASLVPAWES